ncbi:DegT/DnrJ/EryC1/StrS family aminotransferase [Methanosarcina sp. T3]|uniref:DegT/DnrJ/EryC1/StrS family aminotransferase n=1 Tax=Methanosarcina sp. T3 TaxID=3439062 RepID=UPI003F83D62F
MTYRIPLLRPYFDSEELYEIRKVLDSGWVSQGPKVKEFENEVADYVGAKYAIAVTNCTAALHLALLSLDVSKGDEVLVADYTFPATGHSVLYCGAKPVFVDIDPATYNIDPNKIEEKITESTKAIIPVHTFGQPAEMDKIMEIANDYNLKVVEDAACSLGAEYKNKYVGTIGDLGCYSFHARKGITTGEGGMVVTNDRRFAEKVRYLSVFGMETAHERESADKITIPSFSGVGYNYKMSDISAAVGVAQMKKIEQIIKRKRDLAKYYDEKLKDIDGISSPWVHEDVTHVYQSYVTLVDKQINRNELIDKLRNKGVQTQIGTYSSFIQPVYNSKEKCQNSLDVFSRALTLPIYYTLKEEEIDFVCRTLMTTLRDM